MENNKTKLFENINFDYLNIVQEITHEPQSQSINSWDRIWKHAKTMQHAKRNYPIFNLFFDCLFFPHLNFNYPSG